VAPGGSAAGSEGTDDALAGQEAPAAGQGAPVAGHEALAEALAGVLGTGPVTGLRRLSGGASRETWAFEAGGRPLILQRERPARVPRVGMAIETALLRAARERDVPVPAVVAADADAGGGPLGRAWMVVERIDGETIARRILRDDAYAAARPRLAAQCGDALARIHAIDPAAVPGLAGGDQIAQIREALDAVGEPHPVFELGFRWLERHRPPGEAAQAVVHGDFRNGNLVVGPEGLRAVLDWELAHLGDPLEDLGWLCVRAWRFGAEPRVGGFGPVDELVGAYEATAGVTVDRAALRWWEVLGTLKWGIICVVQASTHLGGLVRSVELAAIGRRVCEVEHDLLLLLPGGAARSTAAGPAAVRRAAGPPPATRPSPPGPDDAAAQVAGRPGSPHDAPTAGQLVEAVREFLEGDVMATAEGRVRFHARVAARVLATVERELAAGDGPARAHAARLAALGFATDAELAAAVRSGSLDDRWDEVASAVRATVADKLAVANPTYAAGAPAPSPPPGPPDDSPGR
jgi:aminoglycoside phosphotransferase (APT) family kinase protein